MKNKIKFKDILAELFPPVVIGYIFILVIVLFCLLVGKT